MKSGIALELEPEFIERISSYEHPDFCSWSIPYAASNLITLDEGFVLRQSFDSYLAHIETFEYLLDEDLVLEYLRPEATIFLFLMFEGYSSVYSRSQNLLSESKGGAFHMGYINKGRFIAKIKKGTNRLLLFNLKPDWLIEEAETLPEFKTIISHFTDASKSMFSLPHCPLNKEVLASATKLLVHDGVDWWELKNAIQKTLSELIGCYHKMLLENNYTTAAIHKLKSADIASFVMTNFADKNVDNVAKLADMFNTSERQIERLAKKGFGMPLHEYVIAYRMTKALVMLLKTKKTIKQVAAEVGYVDSHYFSRAFKKFHHILPSEVHGLCR